MPDVSQSKCTAAETAAVDKPAIQPEAGMWHKASAIAVGLLACGVVCAHNPDVGAVVFLCWGPMWLFMFGDDVGHER